MDTRALNQLHDTGNEDVSAVADGVDLDLFTDDILVDQDGLVRVDLNGGLQIVAELLLVCNDLHRAAAKHEGGTHQYGVSDLGSSTNTRLDIGHRLALRLRNVEGEQELFEQIAVLSLVDRVAVGSNDLDTAASEGICKVDGSLSAERRNDALGIFKLDDIHHVLRRQRLKVELVGGGVVGGNGLGIVVDDDRLVARILDGGDRVNRGVVKLNTLSNTDGACAKHHDLLLVGHDGMVLTGVGGIEIRNIRIGVEGICHAEDGNDLVLMTEVPNVRLLHAPKSCNADVGESDHLGSLERCHVAHVCRKQLFHLHDALECVQEEGRDLGNVIKTLDGFAAAQKLTYRKYVIVLEHRQILSELLVGIRIKFLQVEVVCADLKRAHRFEETLLEVCADAHDLSRCLHLRAQGIGCRRELVKRESGKLCNHVVERRCLCRRGVGNSDLLEGHSDGDLRGYLCDGVSARLGCQRGGTGYTGIDLDEVIFLGLGMERKLHVTSTLDLERTDQIDRAVIEHLQLFVVQRKNGSDHDGVTGVHAYGVDILHAADRDDVVTRVSHHLKLDLLEALHALLDEDLMHGRELERVHTDLDQFLLVVGKAASRSAQRERGTKNDGIADVLSRNLCLIQGIGDLRGNGRLADRLAELLEHLSVLCLLDAGAAGSQKLYLTLLENALLLQLHRKVQTCLTADTGNDRIRSFIAKDLCDILQRQRLHINLIRNGRIRHNGCGVRVAKHYLVAFLLERKTSLRSCVVKFGSLTDDDRAGSDNHNLLQICSLWHCFVLQYILLLFTYFFIVTPLPIRSFRYGRSKRIFRTLPCR